MVDIKEFNNPYRYVELTEQLNQKTAKVLDILSNEIKNQGFDGIVVNSMDLEYNTLNINLTIQPSIYEILLMETSKAIQEKEDAKILAIIDQRLKSNNAYEEAFELLGIDWGTDRKESESPCGIAQYINFKSSGDKSSNSYNSYNSWKVNFGAGNSYKFNITDAGMSSQAMDKCKVHDAIYPNGVTCKKCHDFNEYCSTPSEDDGSHLCYKCRCVY